MRDGLTQSSATFPVHDEAFADPAATEALVAGVWEKALRRKSIDRDADFRALGMNSNRSMQIIRDIWTATGVELPINSFFEAPTIRRMAAGLVDGSVLVVPDVTLLRAGDPAHPLFLFPGGGGVMIELIDLVDALDFPGTVYGIGLSGLDGVAPVLDTFEAEAVRARRIIGQLQPSGPYRLAGYSAGGITALETARAIKSVDPAATVFLGLLDTPQNDHSWPLSVWLRFMRRKLVERLRKAWRRRMMARKSAPAPISKAETRVDLHPPRLGTQYEYRFRNPNLPDYPRYTPYWVTHYTPKYHHVGANLCRLKGRYMPSLYEGPVSFFASERGDPLVCDPQEVWPPYLPNAEWVRFRGNHLSMMIGRHAAALAKEMSDRIRKIAPAD